MTGRISELRHTPKLSRPIVPSRGTFWLWFGLSLIFVFGGFAYLLWVHARGLIDWPELWVVEFRFFLGGMASAAIGLLYLMRWIHARRAASNYDLMIESLPYPQ